MKILLLGGTGDARNLALNLFDQGYNLIYSIAGIVRKTPLPCEVHTGGFSQGFANGAEGMAHFIKENAIELVLDATHPYAEAISHNAVLASQQTGVSCWRYERPAWEPEANDNWQSFDQLSELIPELCSFNKPFFTIGRGVFGLLDKRLAHQQWIIRTAGEYPASEGCVLLREIGPYGLNDEVELIKRYEIDAIITKNSGGEAVAAKLMAARQLKLPVFIQNRPMLTLADKVFDNTRVLLGALVELRTNAR